MFNVCRVDAGASPTDGPYSRAVRVAEFLFPSGQGVLARMAARVRGTIVEERRRAVKKRKAVLERAGLTLGARETRRFPDRPGQLR